MTSKIINLHRPLSLEAGMNEFHRKFADALTAEGKCINARLAAGQILLDLRKLIEAGEAGEGVDWWAWYESKSVRSRRDAEKVMALARAEDPEAAVAAQKEQQAVHNKTYYEKTHAALKSRSNGHEEQPKGDPALDIVDHAFLLVGKMNAEQLERFIAKLKEQFKW